MSNPYFKFKQFTVWHDRCAMKTGTDGTLLGAWANVDDCHTILDIGTGSGLVALMLAQRNRNALIDGVEIDPDACLQATENVAKSPFADRIRIHCASFQTFAENANRRYDLIVSNPPYFVRSLQSPAPKRQLARHNDSLSHSDLIDFGSRLLSPGGRMALILPFQHREQIIRIAESRQLYCIRLTAVYPASHLPPKRLLIEFATLFPACCERTNLILEDEHHHRTCDYQTLTQDFYL